MSLFYKYNNTPSNYVPKNKTDNPEDETPTLILNATNNYLLTFDFTDEQKQSIQKVEWLFKKGYNTIISKELSPLDIINDDMGYSCRCILSAKDSSLFELGDDAEMQVKFTVDENVIWYSIDYQLNIINVIDSNIN